jgi:hypothetical protein
MKDKIVSTIQQLIPISIVILIFGILAYLFYNPHKHPTKKAKEYLDPRIYEIHEPDTIKFNDSVYIFSKRLDTVYLDKK